MQVELKNMVLVKIEDNSFTSRDTAQLVPYFKARLIDEELDYLDVIVKDKSIVEKHLESKQVPCDVVLDIANQTKGFSVILKEVRTKRE